MSYQRFQLVTGPDRDIIVELSSKAHIKVMDRTNLFNYESNQEYQSYGPKEKVTKAKIKVPSLGKWFIIVEAGPEVSVDWSLT